MEKYNYKPYNKIFPKLFQKEKERILSIMHKDPLIEHIGSTAVPNLGGKGIIDIAIAVDKKEMELSLKQLESLGYEFRPSFSTPDRFYFVIYLPDFEEGERRYHIHLTYLENRDWKELINFKNYLRNNPTEMIKYAEIKKQASLEANQDGEQYRKLKKPFFNLVNSLMNKKS